MIGKIHARGHSGYLEATPRGDAMGSVGIRVVTPYGSSNLDVAGDVLADMLESTLTWRIETNAGPRQVGETFDVALATGATHRVERVGGINVTEAGNLRVDDVDGKPSYVVARGEWHSFARVTA